MSRYPQALRLGVSSGVEQIAHGDPRDGSAEQLVPLPPTGPCRQVMADRLSRGVQTESKELKAEQTLVLLEQALAQLGRSTCPRVEEVNPPTVALCRDAVRQRVQSRKDRVVRCVHGEHPSGSEREGKLRRRSASVCPDVRRDHLDNRRRSGPFVAVLVGIDAAARLELDAGGFDE